MADKLEFDLSRRLLQLLSPDEIYAAASDVLLSLLKEDRRIERKPAAIRPDTVGDYLSMFANTPPDGGGMLSL